MEAEGRAKAAALEGEREDKASRKAAGEPRTRDAPAEIPYRNDAAAVASGRKAMSGIVTKVQCWLPSLQG